MEVEKKQDFGQEPQAWPEAEREKIKEWQNSQRGWRQKYIQKIKKSLWAISLFVKKCGHIFILQDTFSYLYLMVYFTS